MGIAVIGRDPHGHERGFTTTRCRHHVRGVHRRPVSRLARGACSFGSYIARGVRRSSGFTPNAFLVIASAGPHALPSLADSVNDEPGADTGAHSRGARTIETVSVAAASSVVALSWGIIVPKKLLLLQSYPHPLPLRSLSMKERRSFKLELHELPGSTCTQLRLSGQLLRLPSPCSLRRWLSPMAHWSGHPVELVLSADSGTVAWFECWGDITAVLRNDLLSVRFVDSIRTARDV